MNIAMTGLGPNFNVNTADPIATFQAQVLQQDDAFLISYSIGQQVKIAVGNNSFEYKNSAINGSVKLHEGKPVLIAVENGRNYILSIEAAKNTAEQGAAANP
jgi:antitoxin component of MazEF toxin-antitoxin module